LGERGRKVVYGLIELTFPYDLQIKQRRREVINGLVEGTAHLKVHKVGREVVDRTIEMIAQFKVGEGKGKVIHWVWKIVCSFQWCEGRREVVNGLVKPHIQPWFNNGQLNKRGREVVDGMIEGTAQLQWEERGGKVINWMIKITASNDQHSKGGREVVYRLIELRSKVKFGDGREGKVKGVIECPQLQCGELGREGIYGPVKVIEVQCGESGGKDGERVIEDLPDG
jgi:hypothetical protein